jgi:adenylate kinase family enzyme
VTTYDFRALNDKEFETLCVDLLSAEFGIRIERFKPGKDSGVDGRWFSSPGNEAVIQCKHLAATGFRGLLRHLKEKERAKLATLNCSRYLLTTSVPLSRANKNAIVAAMAPYPLVSSDVLGEEDLTDLLDRHPEVFRRHHKLWLRSSQALVALLNQAILGRSRAAIDEMREKAALYVPTIDHVTALEHLAARHVVLLTGEPGIGKTTLAQQLVLEHLIEHWELVVVEESVSEAEAVYEADKKQLFYYDDFLGRTFLEALRAKQDSHVVRLISRVARDPSKRFILTSRTNILNQGAVLSDLLADGQVGRNTYELRVGHLKKMDRARILYNHIWHSRLDPLFVDELHKDRRYHAIIDHKNYNPRLIAFVLDDNKLIGLNVGEYWKHVVGTFNNPEGVWDHFFDSQLNQDDRDLVHIVVCNGGAIGESSLRRAFANLRSAENVPPTLIDHRFRIAVRHVIGAAVNRTIHGKSEPAYTLFNPSVADFVQSRLAGADLWRYYYAAIRTTAALHHLRAMRGQAFFGADQYRAVLLELFQAENGKRFVRDEYTLNLAHKLLLEPRLSSSATEATRRWMALPLSGNLNIDSESLLVVFRAAVPLFKRDELRERANDVVRLLSTNYLPLGEPDLVRGAMLDIKSISPPAYERLRLQAVRDWANDVTEHVKSSSVLADFFLDDDIPEAELKLGEFITESLDELGVSLTEGELDNLCSEIDVPETIDENRRTADRDDALSDHWREYRSGGPSSVDDTAAVDDLFDR